MAVSPGLFGLNKSNRDFTNNKSWGKNQFNSSFPASLACFMYSQGLEPVYLKLDSELKVEHKKIAVETLFGLEPGNENLYFAFERDFVPYQQFVEGTLPRVDLVTMDNSTTSCLRGLEVKLTALPDQTTFMLRDETYGCELVIRPDTIVYLAVSIATAYSDKQQDLYDLLHPVCGHIENWTNASEILPQLQGMVTALDEVLLSNLDKQSPLIMQPVWKTIGKSPTFADNCLDMFIWSDFAFTRLFVDITKECAEAENVSRIMRTSIWLTKILYDYSRNGQINHETVIDELSYNTKNDKAFSLPGVKTHKYMTCNELTNPRVTKNDISRIILGGGEKFLSPERRFDAVIVNTPGLFESI
ncbi:HindVP family restriction endonuclease [Peribacillus sp. NPDC097264]|uniref:HindVP family restriction endonuclease n=1 Tax=Peribacillus sp. NPDC097264 TaxID=3390616 RepID=UPI003CFEDB67